MKQFAYLDDRLVNSLLAQAEEGLTTSFSQTKQSSTGEQNGTTKSGKISGGFPGILKADVQAAEKALSSRSLLNEESYEIVWNDFAVNRLIENYKLSNKYNLFDYDDGDLILYTGNLTAMNFTEMSNLLNATELKSFLSSGTGQQGKSTNATWKGLQPARDMFSYGSKIFANSQLFIAPGFQGVAIGDISKNRLSDAQMALINDSDIPITMLGVKRNTFDESVLSLFGNNSDDFNIQSMLKVPKFLQSVFLKHMNLVANGGAMIEPIAIYFDVPTPD